MPQPYRFRNILIFYSLLMLVLRFYEDIPVSYLIEERLSYRIVIASPKTTTEEPFISNVTESWKDIQVTSIPPTVNVPIVTTNDVTDFIEEYGLLLHVVPSSKLFDIRTSFQLHSSRVILSKLIPNEDVWYSKGFNYQRDIWCVC